MKGLITAVLIGAAAAGLVYYFRDNEKVKNVLDKVKDTATNGFGKINETWGKTSKQVGSALHEQA